MSFSLIGFLYVIIAGSLCYILPVPEIIKGFLALPGFLIIPYIIGNISFYGIKYFLKIDDAMNKISRFILYWCMGIVVITLLAMFLESINMFNIYSYVGFLGTLSVLGIIKDVSKNKNSNNKISPKNNFYALNCILPLSLSFLIGITTAIFITYFSPFPLMYGIDVFIWSFFSGTLINYGHFFLSGSYFPTFSVCATIMEIIFNMVPNQMPLFWAARFLTYSLYSFGIYLLFYQLSKDNRLSLLGSLVAVWFTVYNPPFIDIMLYYFTPKIVVFVMFPFLLYLIYTNLISGKNMPEFKNKEIVLLLVIPMSYILILFLANQLMPAIFEIYAYIACFTTLIYLFILRYIQNNQLKKKIFILTIACAAIFFFHIPMGLLAIIILLLWLFVWAFITKYKAKTFPIVYLFGLCVILYVILQFYDIVQFSNIVTRYGVDARNIWPDTGNFHYLFNLITTSYVPALFVFFCLGIVLAFVRNKHQLLNYSLAFTLFFIIFIYFLPITFMERLIPFSIPFLAYFISFGIINIITVMRWKYKSFDILFFILTITIVVTMIIVPYLYIINEIIPVNSKYYPYYTFYDEKEYNVYNSLINSVKNNNTKTIIISDLLTKYIAAGIFQKDIFAGGSEYKIFTEEQEMDIFWANNSRNSYDKINVLLSNKTFTCFWYDVSPRRCDNLQPSAIIIIHSRTEGMFKALQPNRIGFKVNIEKFFNSTYFTPLNNDSEIYIFGVNPEPGVPFKIENEN